MEQQIFPVTPIGAVNQPPCPITSLFVVDQDFTSTVQIDSLLLEALVIPFPKLSWNTSYSGIKCIVDETIYQCRECAQNNVTLDTEFKELRIEPGLRENDEFKLILEVNWPNGVSAPKQEILVTLQPGQLNEHEMSIYPTKANYEEWNVLTTKRLLQCACGLFSPYQSWSLPYVSPLDVTPLFTCDLSATCASQIPYRHPGHNSGQSPFAFNVADACNANYISFNTPQGITGGFTGTLTEAFRAAPTYSDWLTLQCGANGGQYSVTLTLRPRCTWTTVTPYYSATIYFQCCDPTATISSLTPKTSNVIQNGSTRNYVLGSGAQTIYFDYDVGPSQVCKTLDTANMVWTMDGSTNLLTTPPAFLMVSLATNVPFMTIDSSDLNVADSHTFSLTIKVASNSGASFKESTIAYTVVLQNPCLTAAWNTNSVAAMTTSVNVSPTLAPQTFTASTLNTATNCGTVTYALNDTLSFVSLSDLSITVVSINAADVGTHYLAILATAGTYTTNKQTMPFTVTIQACKVTHFQFWKIYVRVNGVDAALTNAGTYDYILGSPLAEIYFQQIESPACDRPATTVTQTIDNSSTSGFAWLQASYSQFASPSYPTQSFCVSSTSSAHAGTHTIGVSVRMTDGAFDQTVTSSFQLNLVNPCLTTSFNTCTQTNMVTSVNVSPTLSPQSITECTVAANINCGLVNYSLDQTYSYLTFDSVGKTLTLISSNEADIGVHNVNLIATLASYSSVTLTMPFQVTINACQITSFYFSAIRVIQSSVGGDGTSVSNAGSYDYILGSGEIVVYFYHIQSPWCKNPHSNSIKYIDGTDPSNFNWCTLVHDGFQSPKDSYTTFAIEADLPGLAGTYELKVQVTMVNGTFSHVVTNTMNLKLVNPCLTTTFNPCVQTNMATSVNAIPTLPPQSITQCTVVANIDCGPVIYALDAVYPYIVFESFTKSLIAISTDTADIGSHTVNLVASLSEYGAVSLTMPFTVTIASCQITSATGPQIFQNNVAVSLDLNVPVQYIIGSASQNFTFVYSQTPDCQYPWPSTVSVNSVASPTLNWISSSTSSAYLNPTIVISSTSRLDAGSYSFGVSVPVSNGTYLNTLATSMTFEIIDPCLTTTFNPCSQTGMSTSVLVSPTLPPQSITQCTISATIDCGTIAYALDQTYTFLTFDSVAKTLSAISTSAADVGPRSVILITSLASYPSITLTMPFTVTIDPCQITSAPSVSTIYVNGVISSLVSGNTFQYIIGSSLQNLTFAVGETPDCQYPWSNEIKLDGVSQTLPWISYASATSSAYANVNVGIHSTNRAHAGVYNLAVNMWIINNSFQARIDTQITLELVDPCLTTNFNANSVSPMTTSVLVSPVLADQIIVASTYAASIDCGIIDYSLDKSYSFLTLSSSPLSLKLESTSAAEVGPHNIVLTATLASYPTITLPMPFIVTINPCIPTGIVPAAGNIIVDGGNFEYIIGSEMTSVTFYFDQSPACGYSISSVVQISQNTTYFTPLWISATKTGDQFTYPILSIVSKDLSDEGIYDLTITSLIPASAHYSSTPSNTILATINIVNPCYATALISQTIQDMETSVSATTQLQPQSFSQFTTELTTVSCGQINYALIPSLKFVQLDLDALTITVSTEDPSDVGIYFFSLQVNLVDYPKVLILIPFKITINEQVISKNQKNAALKPYFLDFQTVINIKQGASWFYSLPLPIDPQETQVLITVNLGTASLFTDFKDNSFQIARNVTTKNNIGEYKIVVTLSNEVGQTQIYPIYLNIEEVLQSNSSNSEQENDGTTQNSSVIKSDSNSPQSQFQSQDAQQLESNTFDWANAFAKAQARQRQSEQQQIIVDPDVFITKMSNQGLVTLKFTKKMNPVPLIQIQNAVFFDKSSKKNFPALQISVVPGEYSNATNLKMSYNISSYSEQDMQIQVDFENPLLISQFSAKDSLKIVFLGNFYYFDTQGRLIPPQKTLTTTIPKQVDKKTAASLKSSTQTLRSTSQALMGGNFIVNLLLSSGLSQLFGMINTQQIILMMPLMQVNLPPNAGTFYGFLMNIASFNILPTDLFYARYLPVPDSDGPINSNFYAIGYGSRYFLVNLGSVVVFLALIPLLFVILLVLQIVKKYHFGLQRLFNKLGFYLFWNYQITTYFETFSVVSMCAFIATEIIDFDSKVNSVNSVLAIFFLSFCTLLPLIIAFFMWIKFKKLDEKRMRHKYGELYNDLDLREGPHVILVPFLFLIRRYMLGVVVVFQSKLITQIIALFGGSLAQLIFMEYFPSYNTMSKTHKVLFDELIIAFTMYTMLCFTDFLKDPNQQFSVGYISCGLVCLHLFVNLGMMLLETLGQLVLYAKRFYNRFKKNSSKKVVQDLAQKVLTTSNTPLFTQKNKPDLTQNENSATNFDISLNQIQQQEKNPDQQLGLDLSINQKHNQTGPSANLTSVESFGTEEEISSNDVQDVKSSDVGNIRNNSNKIDEKSNSFDSNSMPEENFPVARVQQAMADKLPFVNQLKRFHTRYQATKPQVAEKPSNQLPQYRLKRRMISQAIQREEEQAKIKNDTMALIDELFPADKPVKNVLIQQQDQQSQPAQQPSVLKRRNYIYQQPNKQ